MQFIIDAVNYVLNLGGAILLPFLITILGLFFGIKFFDSLRNGLRIGIGLIGMNTIVGVLTTAVMPMVEHFTATGKGYPVVDVGWEGVAGVLWSNPLVLVVIPIALIVNYLLVKIRFTKTMNVDIWNYITFVGGGILASEVLKKLGVAAGTATVIAICVSLLYSILACKIGDWLAPKWQEWYGLEGTTCTTLDFLTYVFPMSWAVCKVLDKIPGINKIDINVEKINEKLGGFGETSVLTFFLGIILSIISQLSVADALTMSVTLSACVILLPKMVAILMEGLSPIAAAARNHFQKKLGDDANVNIGMDVAICFGDEAGVACAVPMIPIAILLAFVLPINYFPLAGMGMYIYFTCSSSLFAKGNIFKILVSSTVILTYIWLITSWIAPFITEMALAQGTIQAGIMVTGQGLELPPNALILLIGKILGTW